MPLLERYRDYFDIDPDYFPAVNEAVIKENPEMWKKFYPHTTFVRLLKDTVRALTRQQKLSIWVEGAYGTGKSHAVLTLKKLLDADENETAEYFQKFNLDKDLLGSFQSVKNGGDILTVHRYGSSSIKGDHNLIFAIQESIQKALSDRGIENKNTLVEATAEWLSIPANKNYFNELITSTYADLFAGDKAEAVITKLSEYSGDALIKLMDKISKVADEQGMRMLSLDADGLSAWIKSIIKTHNLKAIVFIWDEFTEFFNNNKRSLTGFQQIAEISETDPFYLMIVTHKSAALFDDGDKDKNKILGRFIKPTCIIELPENMAFQLMGAAMEKNKDEEVLKDWEETVDDLYDRTDDSRKLVKINAKISDEELKSILPIHPYTALLLKHISSAFDSNQRSMFDFIKNEQSDNIKGFQWYIDNYGPEDENPLLTVDMLWEFFYEKGKEYLSHDIRSILDCYQRATTKNLSEDEKRVLKTTLLLQAISQKAGDSVELFIPNEKNIDNAFEGSDMEHGASRCAEKLVRDEILYNKPLGGGKTQFSALVNTGDMAMVDKHKDEVKKKLTSALIDEGQLSETITLTGALKLRYVMKYVSTTNFDSTIKQLRNQESSFENKIVCVVALAKDDNESVALNKKIKDATLDDSFNIVFIDGTTTPLGKDGFEQYCDNMAQSMYHQRKDDGLARQFDLNAKDALKKWKTRIIDGEFIVYSKSNRDGKRTPTLDALYTTLQEINREKYPDSLESKYVVTDNMYMPSAARQGAGCGLKQEVSGTFKSTNPSTKLENALEGAWGVDEYWKSRPELLISKIKNHIDTVISEAFENNGRISIARIYDELKAPPYGFMPCNLSAFIMGFILKEYINDVYSFSDNTVSDSLSVAKMQEMIYEIISHQITPNSRYKDKYIVALTEDEKAFIEFTSTAFGLSKNSCSSIEQTRENIRRKMQEYSFPIWTLKYIIGNEAVKCDATIICEIIDNLCGIANNNNMSGQNSTDNDIAYSIGRLYLKNIDVAEDMKMLLSKEKCVNGMQVYLEQFEQGILISLAEEIADNGQYINVLRKKFDSDAANWVWNTATADNKIAEVILEYKLIAQSNKVISRTNNIGEMTKEWCDKCKYIRISYEAAKNYLTDIAELLEILHAIKKAGTILDSQKQKLYNLLIASAGNFNEFYKNQVTLFKQVCEHYLHGLTDEDINSIYMSIPADSFTKGKAEYLKLVESKVDEFKRNSKSTSLRKLWQEKTNTETPREWSKKYKMPVLCLIEDGELQSAKAAFGVLNKRQSDNNSIDRAIEFISNAKFFNKLENETDRDMAFKKSIIKSYAVMLTNIDEVKDYLSSRIDSDPYDWFTLPEVDKKLNQLAEAKYNQGGCDKALEKIDNMDIADVKRYLKGLIQDNMTVGMAIIEDN